MSTPLFFRSFLVGMAVAAPIGPIGILVIRRSLAFGMPSGFAAGLGAAVADACFALAAALGLTAIAEAAGPAASALRIGGGAFLCILGFRALRRALPGSALAEDGGPRTLIPRLSVLRSFLET